MQELTIFHPPGYFELPDNPFGKDVANLGLFQALARFGGYRQVNVLNQVSASPERIASGLFAPGKISAEVASGTLWSADLAARAGVLVRGQPYLSELAWIRRDAALDQAYSLVGLIHTMAPPAIREMIGAASLAPVHPWDALVCTSPAVQQALTEMFDTWAAHLAERLGAVRSPRPQLPLIPLAVDVEGIAASASDRPAGQALRARCGLQSEDVMVLWVGRLSFYEKAFPQAMFQAVAEAARDGDVAVHFVLAGWFPGGDGDQQRYRQAAEVYAPGLPVTFLDGNDPALVAAAWSAADIFLSLVDNVQETFGLAPVEAMAAGLPVVASDWDGYQFTIRDGVDGFLVPTLLAPGGALGRLLSHLHGLGLETYQSYVGAVAQHTAVHVGRAAQALRRLIQSPELRRSMGDSARRRAREQFSWPVVVNHYNALFAELKERRSAAAQDGASTAPASIRVHPMRGDPFADFHGFATAGLRDDTALCFRQGQRLADYERVLQVDLDRMFPGVRGRDQEHRQLLELLEAAGSLQVAQLLDHFPPQRHPFLRLSLAWLVKIGLLDWLPAS